MTQKILNTMFLEISPKRNSIQQNLTECRIEQTTSINQRE